MIVPWRMKTFVRGILQLLIMVLMMMMMLMMMLMMLGSASDGD